MRIGVPRQTAPGERRVSLTPDVAHRLVDEGHTVLVEAGAGEQAGHLDGAYAGGGAVITDAPTAWNADVVATIEPPDPEVDLGARAILGLLQPLDRPEEMRRLARTGVAAFAFEAVPRTTRAQAVDALSSQATCAGYQAVLEAAARSDRFFPMLTTAAGTIAPAKVVVLGAGVAGLQAIATARRLGAVVSAFDVRKAAAEQIRSLGASFIDIDLEAQDASTSGGYAREVGGDEQSRMIEGLAAHVARADVVITTAAIPGRPAPLLITKEMVASMRPGAVIVDLAASTGGNCEVSRPGETIQVDRVTIVADTDLPSRVAGHASQMYSKNVVNFLDLITGEGGELDLDVDDEIVHEALITRDGEVVHPRVEALLDEGDG